MAGESGTLSSSSITLNAGESGQITFDGYLYGVESADTSIATVTVDGESSGTITITGVSAGNTTATVHWAGRSSIISITVTASDDTSFLNKRGLAYFWDKINAKKQNKLTAGSNITINGDTISASQPAVNNGKLTIQKNGSSIGTFTANQSSNTTANIIVPTKTSDLTNDSNFVSNTSYATASTGGVVKVGSGLSIANGVLSTTGGGVADAVEWTNVLNKPNFSTVATSGSYNDLSNKPTIPTVNNGTLTIKKNGTNVATFTANQSSNATANITVPTKTSDLTNDSNFIEDANYVHTDNNYTTAEKSKLAGIAAGAEVNVQSDWATSDATFDSYIKNKPTIGNGKITIKKNGTKLTVFTANQTADVEANITVPTTVAELSDASTYVTQSNLATQLANKQNVLTAGDHINIADNTIKAVDYVHSDNPVPSSQVTQTVTNDMIATGTITADKFATGEVLKLTLSTSDIGEDSPLASNTLYGVYK